MERPISWPASGHGEARSALHDAHASIHPMRWLRSTLEEGRYAVIDAPTGAGKTHLYQLMLQLPEAAASSCRKRRPAAAGSGGQQLPEAAASKWLVVLFRQSLCHTYRSKLASLGSGLQVCRVQRCAMRTNLPIPRWQTAHPTLANCPSH
eukprot:358913-Chlamydomonas_euryale.AAC.1